ncbi:MAG TPA: fumarylacetoacetate hydrolase family protein [Candidatus Dormibacteraeota bacterium]|nr:fumarylacetoacetate hydrolase family protein [Candidatus Dormibacteraeota bacterium]
MSRIARATVDGATVFGEVEDRSFHPLAGDPYSGARRTGASVPLDGITLLSPSVPRKMLMMMGGFMPADGSPLPPDAVPWLTPKIPSWVNGDGAELAVPPFLTKDLWVEPELAIVIGREIHRASREEAKEAILGFTCFNDSTASEYLPAGDWWRAKSIEGFATMGPWVDTDLTEEDILEGLALRCRVNGQSRCDANTSRLKWPVSYVVSFASQYTTLYPGDVISLGTPQPGIDVHPGDECEIEVEGIGVLHNTVVAEKA